MLIYVVVMLIVHIRVSAIGWFTCVVRVNGTQHVT
jgi:hypothetical protein